MLKIFSNLQILAELRFISMCIHSTYTPRALSYKQTPMHVCMQQSDVRKHLQNNILVADSVIQMQTGGAIDVKKYYLPDKVEAK